MSEKGEGRIKQTGSELYTVALQCVAQPRWHVFSRFWHNIWVFLCFFLNSKRNFFQKLLNSPSAHFQTCFLQNVSDHTCLLFKKLAEYCKKKKRHFHWTSYNPPSNFCKALALLGRAQAKIQHLSSQRSNKAPKSGAFTIIQYRKASRNPPFSQVVRTSSSLFLNFSSF